MKIMNVRPVFAALIASMVLAACGGAATPTLDAMVKPAEATLPQPTEDAMMAKPTEDAMLPKPTEDAMMKPTESAMGDAMMSNSPAWFDIALKDVNSGQAFKLSDFKGQIVLVEGMAAWCTTCLRQQRELVNLHDQIGDAAISVAIDVDLNEDEALLKRHAESNGFTWRYAIGGPELVQALAAEFGNKFLNPPSVPMFLIDKDGGVHLLDFGIKSVEYLTAQIQSYQ